MFLGYSLFLEAFHTKQFLVIRRGDGENNLLSAIRTYNFIGFGMPQMVRP